MGGLITLGFVALFWHKNKLQHLFLETMLALVVGGAIYVIVMLNFPFSGDIGFNPDGCNYLIELAGWNNG